MPAERRRRAHGVTPSTSPSCSNRYRSGLGTGRRTGSMVGEKERRRAPATPTTAVDALAWAILEDDPGRDRGIARQERRRRGPAPKSWPGPWLTPQPCA